MAQPMVQVITVAGARGCIRVCTFACVHENPSVRFLKLQLSLLYGLHDSAVPFPFQVLRMGASPC